MGGGNSKLQEATVKDTTEVELKQVLTNKLACDPKSSGSNRIDVHQKNCKNATVRIHGLSQQVTSKEVSKCLIKIQTNLDDKMKLQKELDNKLKAKWQQNIASIKDTTESKQVTETVTKLSRELVKTLDSRCDPSKRMENLISVDQLNSNVQCLVDLSEVEQVVGVDGVASCTMGSTNVVKTMSDLQTQLKSSAKTADQNLISTVLGPLVGLIRSLGSKYILAGLIVAVCVLVYMNYNKEQVNRAIDVAGKNANVALL